MRADATSEEQVLRVAPGLLELPDGRRVVLFAATTLQTCVLEHSLWAEVQRLLPAAPSNVPSATRSVVRTLQRCGALVSASESTCRGPVEVLTPECAVRTLRLLFTLDCGLRCEYCQVERNLVVTCPHGSMSASTLGRALALFKTLMACQSRATIIFTGGEPLEDSEGLWVAMRACRAALPDARLVLFTNGVHLVRRAVSELASARCFVLVSLDGASQAANRYRFGRSPSLFDKVQRGVGLLREGRVPFGISATVTDANVDSLVMVDVPSFVQLGAVSLGLNLCHRLASGQFSGAVSMARYASVLAEVFHATAGSIVVENVGRFLRPIILEEARYFECSASGSGVTVLPDGRVGHCKSLLVLGVDRPADGAGRPWEDAPLHRQFLRRSPLWMARCSSCWAQRMCGGGCALDAFVSCGSLCQPDEGHCEYVKALSSTLIRELVHRVVPSCSDPLAAVVPSIDEKARAFGAYFADSLKEHRSAGHE